MNGKTDVNTVGIAILAAGAMKMSIVDAVEEVEDMVINSTTEMGATVAVAAAVIVLVIILRLLLLPLLPRDNRRQSVG